jgi:hypothetical protein
MIPTLRPDGNLPNGVHWATWQEINDRFGGTVRRRYLLAGLKRALDALREAGCTTVYLDGSFVAAKQQPADFDACWDPTGVDLGQLDPTLFDFEAGRRAQKRKYGGELFPATAVADTAGATFLDFFQTDRETGVPKGIIAIDLRGVP